MSKYGITARIAGGFGAIIVLLVGVSLVAIFGIQTLSGVAEKYRFANAQTSEITDYVSDYDRMVLEVRTYLLNPSTDAAKEARLWIDDVATNDPEGVAKFESLPVAHAELRKIEASAAALRDAFDKLIELEDQHAALIADFAVSRDQLQKEISIIIDAGAKTNQVSVQSLIAKLVQSTLQMETLTSKLMDQESGEAYKQALDKQSAALALLDKLKSAPGVSILSADIESVGKLIRSYGDLANAAEDIFSKINTIRQGELAARAAELASSYDVLTSEVRSNQDSLGPVSEQTASGTMLVVSIVAGLAVLVGIGLAYITGTWLSRSIGGMSQNMSRMADGDLDFDLGPAPKVSELGLMARALETFRVNGLSVRSMDAEKEQAREKERAEQMVRTRLQEEVADVVSAAVSGDFSRRIESRYQQDDLNALADAVNSLVETVDRGVGETGTVLSALAHTDLTQRVTGSYQGAFDKLKQDTNAVAEKLVEVVGQIRQTSRGLKTATGEILSGANDLSERTTKQAATIEETSAAMEQLAHTVMDNAKRAGEASNEADRASATAEEGGKVMAEANEAMERISASSSKISNIIGMIDDIAFQTNLLALNASVEAARAGEAGKGFAVVAVEVRRLAQSSAEASSDVKALIEQSAVEVSGGTKLVASATEKLSAILEAVKINAKQMEEIARDSREQASSIDEVNTAVRQMDEMTQHNAALVEETNAAIEQTEAQASELDRIVEVFTLDERAAAARKSATVSAKPAGGKPSPASAKVAKAYLSSGNAAIDKDWSEF